jgi:hypothetical protein
MADDPTEAAIRKEINRARQILREDKILAKLGKHFPDEPVTDPDAPPVPPRKDPEPGPVRKGLWWGDVKNT